MDRSNVPALTNPRLAKRLRAPDVGYVSYSDQVIGLEFGGQQIAIPLKLLWYHEVINLSVPGERLTVTYSPLTGSVGVFSPPPGGEDDLAVSNYVLNNSLVMEDGSGTLYPQLAQSATCGPGDGTRLARVPYELMTFVSWISIFKDTWVVSRVTGYDFLYTLYPYGSYRNRHNSFVNYPTAHPIDRRRPPKEWVLGVPAGTGGMAFPLSLLARAAAEDQGGLGRIYVWAASAFAGGEPIVAFWNSMAYNARIYRAVAGGRTLTFEVVDGQRRDVETGSVWNFAGEAVSGPLDGEQLPPHPDARHAYWFAWADFHPDTDLWSPPDMPARGNAGSFSAAAGVGDPAAGGRPLVPDSVLAKR